MIDINLIRENPKLVKDNIKKKYQNDRLSLVDEIKEKDLDWRNQKQKIDSLRHQRNSISKEISEAIKSKKSPKDLLKKAKLIPQQIEKAEKKAIKLQEEISSALSKIPNIMHPNVPKGKSEEDNKELRRIGKIKKFNFPLKNHVELAEELGIASFEAGRNNSGQGFNYLIGDLALLDHALQRYGLDFIQQKNFTLVNPPMLLNFKTLLGAVNGLEDFEEVVYKIEKENLYLIGTAEHPLVSLNKDKLLNKKDFPIKLCALTPCFRKEVGSRGVDTKGLYRMHQFNKVEQVVLCLPEDSNKIHEEMQKITEEFIKSFNIPFRVIEICSGDLGTKFARQWDIEAWFPRQEKFGEITSAGTCTDFQSRSLNIKYLDDKEKKYPHILNNTMIATSRIMVAILENFQNKDGSVTIPKVLVPYMSGKTKIEKN
jgi:seryl-tRNA synthetase